MEFSSDLVNSQIDHLLLSGQAGNVHEAEEIFLDAHLAELGQLVLQLNNEDFLQHEAVKLLFAHGGRRSEDAMP